MKSVMRTLTDFIGRPHWEAIETLGSDWASVSSHEQRCRYINWRTGKTVEFFWGPDEIINAMMINGRMVDNGGRF